MSGTGLLLAFLQDAERHGAMYLSDLSYSLQLRLNGGSIECVSKIRVEDGRIRSPDAAAAAPDVEADDGEVEYSTTVRPWRPGSADTWVVDRELVCTQHAAAVAASEPRYDNRYGAEVGRYIAPGRMPVETTKIEHYSQCSYAPHRHYVHRYEHFVAARFSPPDLALLQRRYADATLVEDPPICHFIQLAPGQTLRQHITGDVHFSSQVIVPLKENEISLPQAPRSVGRE